MTISRSQLSSLGLVVASFGMTLAFYGRLPQAVPTHWNAGGRADVFVAKPWGPFVFPLVTAAVWLLLAIIPRISPRGYRIERFLKVYDIMRTAIIAFLFCLTLLALLAGIGLPVRMMVAIPAGVGVLFIVLGNFMGKVTKNFFVGIRTPWTLASDEVWLRTHRLGGKLFVIAGVGILISAFAGGVIVTILTAAAVAGVVPVVYSYVIYRRIEGNKNG